jgi:uncharacterized protein
MAPVLNWGGSEGRGISWCDEIEGKNGRSMKARSFAVLVVLGLGAVAMHAAQGASGLDCQKTSAAAEKVVCADKGLTELDQQMSGLLTVVEDDPTVAMKERAVQRQWIEERNACVSKGGAGNAHGCLEAVYERRIIGLEVETGELRHPKRALWNCGDVTKPLTAAFYNDSAPASAVLAYGGEKTVLLVAGSGSGARYTAPGYEYWEHQGEAAVNWHGQQMKCKLEKSTVAAK